MSEFALSTLSATTSGGDALTFTPAFDTAVLAYTATAPAGATTVTVDATAAATVANIASVQYAVGDPSTATFTDSGTLTVVAAEDNIITVRVANEDDTTTRDYTITLTVPPPPLITLASPTVTRVSSTSGTYNAGKRFVPILVHFSEPVTVTVTDTGRPQLALNGVGTTRFQRVVRGNELLFRYTFDANDNVARLAYTSTDALTLPDGVTIQSTVGGFDADRTLPTPGDDNSLSGSSNVVIDTIAPVFTSADTGSVTVNTPAGVTAYDADATDNGADTDTVDAGLTYTLSGTDAGLFTFDGATGITAYTAVQSAATTHFIVFTATDAAGNATNHDVTITIVDNDTLSFDYTIPDQTWVVGVPVALTLPTATGGNDAPRYTLAGNLPDGITAANNAAAAAPTTLTGTPMAVTDSATLTYTVTDSDQTAPVTSIALTFSAAVRAAGTDATLNALSVMLSDDTDLPLTPAFPAATTAYAVTAPSATTTVTVTATASDANATVAIAGTAANGGTALGVTGGDVFGLTTGDNVITVTVTAEDRSTQDYIITLTVLSADATLNALSVMPSGGMALTLTHSDGTTTDFATGQFTYTARAPAGTTTVTVTADTTDDGADVDIAVTDADGTALTVDPATGEVSGLTTGDNVITVAVTAEDDSTMQAYTITLTVPSADATLRALSITSNLNRASPLPLSPAFDTETTAYTLEFPTGARTMYMNATPTSSAASVRYTVSNKEEMASNFREANSFTISFNGTSLINDRLTVRVIAEDGTTQDYIVRMTIRATASTDADLSDLTVTSDGTALTLSPTFDAGTFAYTATAPSGTTSVTVAATATDSAAGVAITASGTLTATTTASGGTVSGLSAGDHTITVTVTAESGSTEAYIITLTVLASTVDTLRTLSVTPSGGSELTLDPVFTADSAAPVSPYTTTAPSGTESVTIAATATDSAAGVAITASGTLTATTTASGGTVSGLSAGDHTITVTVTAESGSTEAYIITLTVLASTVDTLRTLSVTPSGGSELTLDPVFTADSAAPVSPYTTTAPSGTESVTIAASATDSAAGVAITASGTLTTTASGGTVSGLSTGDHTITVTVTAESSNTQEYIITLTVPPANTVAALEALSVTSGGSVLTLTRSDGNTTGFVTAELTYTATAPNFVTSVTVAATVDATATGARVQYAVGASPAAGAFSTSGDLAVDAGDNVLTVRVIAQDGSTTQNYIITLTVPAASTDALTTRLNEQILTRVIQAVTVGTLAAVAGRVESIGGGAAAPSYQVDGQASLRGLLEAHGKAMLEGEMEAAWLMDDTSFVMPLHTVDEGDGGGLSMWGKSEFRGLDGGNNRDEIDWSGDMLSAHVGVDRPLGRDKMAGFALSWNDGNFDYEDEASDIHGDYQYQVTNINPYFGWLAHENIRLWGMAGYGRGEIEISQVNTDDTRSDGSAGIDHLSLAGGFNGQLLNSHSIYSGVASLALKGDMSLSHVAVEEFEFPGQRVAAQEVGSQRLRLLLGGEYKLDLYSGGMLTELLEVGMRYDGGDGVEGTGIEVGGGLRYVNLERDLTIEGNVRTLLAHQYDEWGIDFRMLLSPPSGRGLSLNVRPVWGKTQSAAERLWNDGTVDMTDDVVLQGSLDAEVGYGVAASVMGAPGSLTPYMGMTAEDDGGNRLRFGGRFSGSRGLSMKLEGTQDNAADRVNHILLLRGELAF